MKKPLQNDESIYEAEDDVRPLYLITHEKTWALDLVDQLNYFNYKLSIFTDLSELKAIIAVTSPTALIIDMDPPNEEVMAWTKSINESKSDKPSFPIIYISSNDALTVHLQAVRSEGEAFFTKPVDIMAFTTRLNLLCNIKPMMPYRILIVEDTLSLSQYYSSVLQQAGMHTFVVNDPLQIKQPLIEFKPDLILMDIYMPQCTGIELASVIRQLDVFTTIPIIYLSSEEDKDLQLKAMNFGGDEFLTKPIAPMDLISVVQRRAQRARTLSSLIVKDSLTNLLNHTAIQEILDTELTRAKRQKSLLAFAMLDLDHFKKINDTYGHPVGDLVLTTLSRLIIKRLRKSDIAGRYGGEEFSLILPNADINNANRICNEIRESFSHLQLSAKDSEFGVTFSCGIACYPDYDTVESIIAASDKALYEAKELGRNRVVSASKKN